MHYFFLGVYEQTPATAQNYIVQSTYFSIKLQCIGPKSLTFPVYTVAPFSPQTPTCKLTFFNS